MRVPKSQISPCLKALACEENGEVPSSVGAHALLPLAARTLEAEGEYDIPIQTEHPLH